VFEELLKDLTSLEERTRSAAVRNLEDTDRSKAVGALIALLDDSNGDYRVRAAAAASLGEIGDARAVDPLIQAARGDKYETVPAAAATALGRLADRRAIECLTELFEKKWQKEVKTAAAQSLASLGAVPALITAVAEGSSEVRWIAAEALASSSYKQELLSLVSRSSSLSDTQKSAIRLLVDREDTEALNLLLAELNSPRWDVRIRAASALKDLADPRSVDAMRKALGDTESSVRVAASEMLHRLKQSPSQEERDAASMKALADLGLKVKSSFAHALKCPKCGMVQAAPSWPVRGDQIPFYSQENPGDFSVKLTCSKCGRAWYIVWDKEDPGKFFPLEN
jgi:HEAT repeat protein